MKALSARTELFLIQDSVQNLEQYELEHFTHSRNPVLSIAGLTTLQVIQQEGLVERAAAFGQRVLDDLHDLTKAHTLVSNVRGGRAFAVHRVC